MELRRRRATSSYLSFDPNLYAKATASATDMVALLKNDLPFPERFLSLLAVGINLKKSSRFLHKQVTEKASN